MASFVYNIMRVQTAVHIWSEVSNASAKFLLSTLLEIFARSFSNQFVMIIAFNVISIPITFKELCIYVNVTSKTFSICLY